MQFIENVSILIPSLARKIFSFFLSFLTSKVNNVTIFFYLALRLDNQELREYVDKLVVYLMDKYPGALESSKMYRWLVNILWRWYVVGWLNAEWYTSLIGWFWLTCQNTQTWLVDDNKGSFNGAQSRWTSCERCDWLLADNNSPVCFHWFDESGLSDRFKKGLMICINRLSIYGWFSKTSI